jgi:hypothetical protein
MRSLIYSGKLKEPTTKQKQDVSAEYCISFGSFHVMYISPGNSQAAPTMLVVSPQPNLEALSYWRTVYSANMTLSRHCS